MTISPCPTRQSPRSARYHPENSTPLGELRPEQTTIKTAVGAIFLVANAVIARTTGGYFDGPAEVNPLLHTWSLSVEEQFYLIWPAILIASWLLATRSGWTRRTPQVMIGVVGGVSFLIAMVASVGLRIPYLPDLLTGFYGPASRAWEFAAGALLALGSRWFVVASRRVATAFAFLGAAGVLASFRVIDATTPFPGVWTLLPVVSTMLLIIAGTSGNLVSEGLSARPMVMVGDLSYSIYLWHWPFIVFASLLWSETAWIVPAAAALSLLPAWISYHAVEQPIRRWDISGPRLVGLMTATVLPPLALSGLVGIAVINGDWSPTVRDYQEAIATSHVGASAGCTNAAWQRADECTWNAGAGGAPIYLVGDSNADQFSEAIVGAGATLDRPVVGLTEDGCEYLNIAVDSERCRPYTSATETYLQSVPNGLVVVANAYEASSETPDAAVGTSAEELPRDPSEKSEALHLGLLSVVRTLEDAGHQVVLVQAVPHWGYSKESLSWAGCSVPHMLGSGCARSMPLTEALERQGPAREMVRAVAAETSAGVVDLWSEMCPAGVCESQTVEGLIRYRDGTHITVPQSEALEGTFTAVLAATG